MSRKPEAVYRDSVHRHLPPVRELHRQSVGNASHTGTPDMYYSGAGGNLWLEWKIFLTEELPTVWPLVNPGKKPALSPRQALWLSREAAWGQSCWVPVAHRESGLCIFIPGRKVYEVHNMQALFNEQGMSRQRAAQWIKDRVL